MIHFWSSFSLHLSDLLIAGWTTIFCDWRWLEQRFFNRESQHDAIFKDNHHWNRQPMIWTYMDHSNYILIIPHILIQWVLELVTWKPHWIITRNRLHLSGGVPEYVLGTMVDWCWNTWDKNSPKRTTFCEIGIHIFTNPKAGIFRSHSRFLIQSWSFWGKWLAKLNAGGHWIGRSTILTTSNHCFLEWPPVILCPAIFKLRFWEFSVWLIRYKSIRWCWEFPSYDYYSGCNCTPWIRYPLYPRLVIYPLSIASHREDLRIQQRVFKWLHLDWSLPVPTACLGLSWAVLGLKHIALKVDVAGPVQNEQFIVVPVVPFPQISCDSSNIWILCFSMILPRKNPFPSDSPGPTSSTEIWWRGQFPPWALELQKLRRLWVKGC